MRLGPAPLRPRALTRRTRITPRWFGLLHSRRRVAERPCYERARGWPNPSRVLLGSGKLATELDRMDLIDGYKFLVHPRLAGHGPTLFQSGLPSTRRLELVSSKPLRCGAVAMLYRRAR